jgi:hypothetical protein
MNTAVLLWSVLFSSIGVGYFIYGKRQQRFGTLFAGMALFIYPYFVDNVYLLVAIGIGLMVVPRLIDF